MKEIILASGHKVSFDDKDFDLVSAYNWYLCKSKNERLYARGRLKINPRIRVQMHRLIVDLLPNEDVDHKDDDGLNNQKDNLRKCSRSQNLQNKRKFPKDFSTSQYKGVCWDKVNQNWKSRIYIEGRRICIGNFNSEIIAAIAYNNAARSFFGDFARINQI